MLMASLSLQPGHTGLVAGKLARMLGSEALGQHHLTLHEIACGVLEVSGAPTHLTPTQLHRLSDLCLSALKHCPAYSQRQAEKLLGFSLRVVEKAVAAVAGLAVTAGVPGVGFAEGGRAEQQGGREQPGQGGDGAEGGGQREDEGQGLDGSMGVKERLMGVLVEIHAAMRGLAAGPGSSSALAWRNCDAAGALLLQQALTQVGVG